MFEILNINDFDKIFDLMEKSFPEDEYRTYEEQKALFDIPEYSVFALKDGTELKAFIAAWEFDRFAYIEHFAVAPEFRNEGLGAKMLGEFKGSFSKLICLEVEPPENEMSKRRIGFYRRNNFFLNEYPYIQPSFSKGKKALPLMVMTSDSVVDKHTFEQIKNTLYREVYKVK